MSRKVREAGWLVLCLLLIAACSDSSGSSGTSTAGVPASAQVSTATPVQTVSPVPVVSQLTPSPTATVAPPTLTPTAVVGTPEPTPTPAPRPVSAAGLPLGPFIPADGRARVVAIDPGHGGEEVGSFGAGVPEKDVNLRTALRLRDLLTAEGMSVVLLRDRDERVTPPAGYEPPADWRPARWDLQARLDRANIANADVYLSIHNNGSGNAAESGTEVWWDGRRPFAAYNQALAEQVYTGLVASIRGLGYPTVGRGTKEDTGWRVFQGRSFPIFVLGPPRTGSATTRAGNMPAALGEALFLSNSAEAPQLTRPEMLDAIARGYRDGLVRYFRLIDSGALALPPGGLPPETPNFYDIQPPNPVQTGDGGR